ncbi:hypothetical protein [Streptomyces sp. ISL-11]|uniref:hypothetical protein n=1 Tax=Streptomyces sp. ISL-11 TaxID=2819174 RepID=UPI001BEA48ED|nr:hypothetical protein [Streptomyces sp. ISL-11]MBT2385669.1 hypothetical protein [Streptomyces sp. ISL-11]
MEQGNVLFGAALHAADRLRAGEQATDLEEMLLKVLRAAVPDEEIKGWGQVYREAVTARGRLAGVPEALTGRPVSEGYSLADWAKDLGPAGEEWMAQSNTALIDPEALAAGEEFDSPEFIEGMREWGFAVTASNPAGRSAGRQQILEQEADGEQAAQAASDGVRVEFENFHVHRVVGDGWPNTRDEIRWLSGGSSATTPAQPFMSREFGDDEALVGMTPEFPPFLSQRVAFDGRAGTGLALNIDCWEWDTGNGNNDDIVEALRAFNRDVMLSTAWSVIMELSGIGILAFLSDITFLAVNFLGWLAKNDLSCRRAFFLDRYDLALLARGDGKVNWHFNGDGYHELRVKFTTSMPFPTGSLEYVVHNGLDAWGTPIPLPWVSMSAPALASYAGALHALYVRPSDQAVLWTRLRGSSWSEPEHIQGWRSLLAPALTAFDGKLYAVHAGQDGRLFQSRYDGSGWTTAAALPQGKVHKAGPSLGANARQMVLSHVEASEVTYDRLGTAAGWQAPYEFPFGKTQNPVSLTCSDQQIYRAVRTLDNRVSMITEMSNSPSGFPWARTDAPTREVTCGPTVVKWVALWILMRATNGTLVAARRTADSHPWHEYPVSAGRVKPLDEVAAAIHLGKMYVMYRR